VPNYLEFFAGGGMVRSALGDGWHCLLANDICHKKASSYASNWGDDELTVSDVHDLKSSDVPGTADLAWASFPCQDLSLAGNGAGLEGERSGAFYGYWKIIKKLISEGRKPNIIALENVCGTLTSHGGKDFETLVTTVIKGGYRVGAMVIDAVHFLPQSRPRLFIIGISDGAVLPEFLVKTSPNPAWHRDAVIRAYNSLPTSAKKKWLWWDIPCPLHPNLTLDSIIESEPVGVEWNSTHTTKQLLEMMNPLNRKKVIEAQGFGRQKVGTIYKRTRDGVQRAEVRFDGIAGCLRTPTGGSSRQTVLIVDDSKIRSRLLSPREVARLMGLPDSYKLPEKYNDAYHLAGDGVAVPVIRHLATSLFEPIVQAQSESNNNMRVA
jgi:DNA (cytosine-5)-methyltransferase 1